MNDPFQANHLAITARLLEDSGLSGEFDLEALSGGRNNKVFRVQTKEESYLLKAYFRHPRDLRDRLGHEFLFLRYLHSAGCCYTARPYASDSASNTGLMEFIEGTRPQPTEVNEAYIDQAILFFREINSPEHHLAARALPSASEACFSIQQHIDTAERRIQRLSQFSVHDETDADAKHFIEAELVPWWHEVNQAILHEWSTPAAQTEPLSQTEQCLSPSDFGFHNSLSQADGRIRFVDFEYAGWDDPAKLVCDFANQPDLLLPAHLSARFAEAVIWESPRPESLHKRVQALAPLYQIKWSCICLNDFLDVGRKRHSFTHGEHRDGKRRRELQLDRARVMLERAKSACSVD